MTEKELKDQIICALYNRNKREGKLYIDAKVFCLNEGITCENNQQQNRIFKSLSEDGYLHTQFSENGEGYLKQITSKGVVYAEEFIAHSEKSPAKISTITRQKIADEMFARKIWYHGRQNETDFLGQIFNLKELPSIIGGKNKNAYDDIYQWTARNDNNSEDWIYSDPRIDLLRCEDTVYLQFLTQTIHPRTRTDENEVDQLFEIYNIYLSIDGFEVFKSDEISGCPLFSWREKSLGTSQINSKVSEIRRYFNSEYVNQKMDIITKSLNTNADLAIGTAKELLETACKSILKQKTGTYDDGMDLPQLVKAAIKHLNTKPKHINDADKAENSVKKILGGINAIVQGIAEIRNAYGTGHGKDPDFISLDNKYVRLYVGAVSEIVIFMVKANGDQAELVEV